VYCGFKPSGFPGGDTDTHDDFTLPDQGANTEGSQTIDGHVKFLEAATLTDPPWTPNSVSEAGILPATTEKPTGWDDAGAEPHSLSVTWRCCNGSSEPKVTGQPEKKKGGKDPRRMRPVERAIWDCTPWAAIRPDDTEGRRRLLAQLQPFKSFTLDEVRSAIKSYMRTAMTTGDRYDVGEMSRLYVLNRFIHCVPPTVPQEEARFYGGWGGVPQTRGQVRVLWPLAERRGQLRVAGHFGGYFGVPYDALGEFDHFRERFGPRWAPGSGQTS
jgi:hypothetical protein